jgi:hypothetical protein
MIFAVVPAVGEKRSAGKANWHFPAIASGSALYLASANSVSQAKPQFVKQFANEDSNCAPKYWRRRFEYQSDITLKAHPFVLPFGALGHDDS